jgi:hypothetical protein
MYMYIVQYIFTRTVYDVSLTAQHTLEHCKFGKKYQVLKITECQLTLRM